MEVIASFVANEEAAIAVQPGEGTLDDPTVASELRFRLDAGASDARGDVSASERLAPGTAVVGLVGVEFGGASARATTRTFDRRNGIDGIEEHGSLIDIGGRLEAHQRDALSVGYQMVLRPGLTTVGRVRADGLR